MKKKHIAMAGFIAMVLLSGPLSAKPEKSINTALSAYSSTRENSTDMPWCFFLVARKTLNDLVYIDQILSNEVSHLMTDANLINDSWQSFGEGSYDVSWDRSSGGVIKRSGYDNERSEIWNLYSSVRILSKDMNAISKKSQVLEREWWSLRKAMKRELDSGGTGSKSAPKLDKFIKNIEEMSSRYNAINPRIPRLQYKLDYVRTDYLRYINRMVSGGNNGAPIDIADPWHWIYRYSIRPRPELEYDFKESFGEYLKSSHNELHTELSQKSK